MDALLQQRGAGDRFNPKDYAQPGSCRATPTCRPSTTTPPTRQFMAPEQASIEYVVLDLDTIRRASPSATRTCASTTRRTSPATPRPGDAREPHPDQADKDAPAAERDKARQRPMRFRPGEEELASFAELAKRTPRTRLRPSAASARLVGRGAMVGPFEDAAFCSSADRSYHVIVVTGAVAKAHVRGGARRDRGRGQTPARRSALPRWRPEFTNTVHEQPTASSPSQTSSSSAIANGVQRRPAGRDGKTSSSTSCSATRRCATSATPRRSEFGANQLVGPRRQLRAARKAAAGRGQGQGPGGGGGRPGRRPGAHRTVRPAWRAAGRRTAPLARRWSSRACSVTSCRREVIDAVMRRRERCRRRGRRSGRRGLCGGARRQGARSRSGAGRHARQLNAQYARPGRGRETLAYYDAPEDALQGRREGPKHASRRRRGLGGGPRSGIRFLIRRRSTVAGLSW